MLHVTSKCKGFFFPTVFKTRTPHYIHTTFRKLHISFSGEHSIMILVTWSELTWFVCKWVCFEVKWSEVCYGEVFGDIGWPYTEGTWLYCDYFMWSVFCAVVVLTYFVMCGCVYVLVLLYVGVLVIRLLVFTVFCIVCIVFLYCFFYIYYLFCLY